MGEGPAGGNEEGNHGEQGRGNGVLTPWVYSKDRGGLGRMWTSTMLRGVQTEAWIPRSNLERSHRPAADHCPQTRPLTQLQEKQRPPALRAGKMLSGRVAHQPGSCQLRQVAPPQGAPQWTGPQVPGAQS